MKRKHLSHSLWAVLLAAFTVSSHGQDENQQRRGRRENAPRPSGGPGQALFEAIDRNGDGKLQQEEIDLAVVSIRRFDANKDGVVEANEIRPAGRPGPAGGPPPDFLARFDENEDGKISKEEAPERMRERFDRMDRNEDGFIDEKELQSARGRRASGDAPPEAAPRPRPSDRRPDASGEGSADKPKRPPVGGE